LLIVAFAFGLLGFATVNGSHPQATQAAALPAAGLKAVIIVGPASGNTWNYIDAANGIAAQAEAVGMSVDKIYTPNATWERVKHESQGANLLVYLGHGNGFPTQHRNTLSEDTEDGFGLNPYDGASVSGDVKYYGADFMRRAIKLAPGSVVLLNRLCYASGNGESGLDYPENYKVAADREQALQRVDNYASGFLAIGASAVFAWGWPQKINLPGELATTDKTVDQIFEEKMGDGNDPQAFIGKYDYYEPSVRTPGATIHLDPDALPNGYLRALTMKDTSFSATDWRKGAPKDPGPDKTPPTLTNVTAGSGTSVASNTDLPIFSPNGDGIDDSFSIGRTMSEPGTITTSVTDATGRQIYKKTVAATIGDGTTSWNGKNNKGNVVADGDYTVKLTPTDKAGNVGKTQSVPVRLLTAIASPTSSTDAIEVADMDKLATGTRLSARLTEPAAVSWNVVDATGAIVRHGIAAKKATTGTFVWRWDGRNDSGAIVPDGPYVAVVSARTSAGVLAYGRNVYVGAFHISFDQDKLYRGQAVRITIYNTEPLNGPVTVTMHPKGGTMFSVTATVVGSNKQVATVTMAQASAAYPVTIVVSGTDTGGGAEQSLFQKHVF
jgi:flagellar hook assembly protein FlgD